MSLVSTITEDRSLQGLLCTKPYWHFEVNRHGPIYHCCSTWLPKPIGNIKETSLLEAIRSLESAEIRASIEDGSFRHCRKDLCPSLSVYSQKGEVNHPLARALPGEDDRFRVLGRKWVSLALNYDRSCNLRCPPCRMQKIMFSEQNIPADLQAIHDATIRSIEELRAAGYAIYLLVTGSGDAFASPLYARLIRELKADPLSILELKTNGVLMEESRFTPDMFQMVQCISVSIDAATADTYRVVREGGNFARLLANLDWLDGAIRAGRFRRKIRFHVNFVVQKENYREMPAFLEKMLAYKSVTEVWFNLISDWGHMKPAEFADSAIWRPDHPEHGEFLRVMADPILRSDPRINLGNVSAYLPKPQNREFEAKKSRHPEVAAL